MLHHLLFTSFADFRSKAIREKLCVRPRSRLAHLKDFMDKCKFKLILEDQSPQHSLLNRKMRHLRSNCCSCSEMMPSSLS